jgi:hypothetical protein
LCKVLCGKGLGLDFGMLWGVPDRDLSLFAG